MIVVDSSVFMAVMAQEPDERPLTEALVRASARSLSAGTYLECAIVAEGRHFGGRGELDKWLSLRRIDVVPVDLATAQTAADAFARFGKGRHPAALNFGDCFSYALAKRLGAPLLFKGNDFVRTDIASALPA